MNYRHHYHAGNFADVWKHVLVVHLVAAMQRKEKGFLYLDTHAGRGAYDLESASRGDSLARAPEWPDGIGRLQEQAGLSELVNGYLGLVQDFDRRQGGAVDGPRHYPGSPVLVQAMIRPQDRMVVCEKQEDECAQLSEQMARGFRCSVQATDGYRAVKAMLPPPEKRALVLIDPPFESPKEFGDIANALKQGLRRLPATVFAIWYPITDRARVNTFFREIEGVELPPTVAIELTVAGEEAPMKMRGCGLLVVNPPWKLQEETEAALAQLAKLLAQASGGRSRFTWLVPDR